LLAPQGRIRYQIPSVSMTIAVPARRTRVRWGVVLMAFLATAIAYVHRANLGVAAPSIRGEMGLSASAMGVLFGAFFWTYAAFMMPSGWFVDRIGPRIAYPAAVCAWSMVTAGCAIARGFLGLVGLRLLLGVAQAPAYPCNAKVVSEWFPQRERAFASSIFDSGSRLGNMLSFPVVGGIIGALGWRASFVITGSLGLIWTVAWLRVYRSPRRHLRISEAELAHIESDQTGPPATGDDAEPVPRWRDLFRYRTLWGMMLGFFCFNFVIYFFITWFPSYLIKERGFTLLNLSGYGMIPPAAAVLGGYAGGLVSDRLVRRGLSLTRARKIPIVGGMAVASSIALAVLAPSAGWALALLALSYSGLAFAAAGIWSLPADVAPSRRFVASIGGIQNCASNLAGVSSPLFVGYMVDRTGGFVAPLVTAGGLALLGALSYMVIVPRIAPLGTQGVGRPRRQLESTPAERRGSRTSS
jgi:ACS family D-galactonate transporter-like MFS transporter